MKLTVEPDSPALWWRADQSVGDMGAHVLVVDDDPAERRHIEQILVSQGHSVEAVGGGEAALKRLEKSEAQPISAVILDLVMPDLDGMAVLERLQRRAVRLPVIVQAAPGHGDAGAAALRAGAFDFTVKPSTPERVKASLANALRLSALESEIKRIRQSKSSALSVGDLVTRSASMQRVRQLTERAARSSLPVLIEGERGVGKELLARVLHGSGVRRSRAFVTVRCGEIDEGKIFDAERGTVGKLREASGGTLFLDEIGALPAAAQVMLAGMLGESESEARAHVLPGDVRLVAATSRRLIDLVSAGEFHQGLFNRLNVLPIWLPPLRERRADIPDLARTLVARLAAETGQSTIIGISRAATELLIAHDWPGNVGELAHALRRAVVLCGSGELAPEHFPSVATGASRPHALAKHDVERDAPAGVAVQEQTHREPIPGPARIADRPVFARYGQARLLDERGEMRPIGVLEEEVIRFAIGHYQGRMSEIARRLGIGRSTLYRKMKDYGIASGDSVVS
jgi:DNA-binding NtrC family response regulator